MTTESLKDISVVWWWAERASLHQLSPHSLSLSFLFLHPFLSLSFPLSPIPWLPHSFTFLSWLTLSLLSPLSFFSSHPLSPSLSYSLTFILSFSCLLSVFLSSLYSSCTSISSPQYLSALISLSPFSHSLLCLRFSSAPLSHP